MHPRTTPKPTPFFNRIFMTELLQSINLTEISSVFIVLFAVIDIIGAIPIVINLQEKGQKIEPFKTFLYSAIILISFLFLGQALLSLLHVDLQSFAAAGAIILFVLAIEMIFGVVAFKDDSPSGSATLVPLVFPLIAGAASFTTLLSFRAQYHVSNIIIATILNLLIVFFVLRHVSWVEKMVGKGGVYVMRKFFGIILLAMAVKLFTENISHLIATIQVN